MKQKMLSKENQGEITRLDELKELLDARTGEKENTISCLKEDIKTLEISNEDFNKQLLEQRDETSDFSVKLKTEINSDNKLKRLSKENQDEISRLNESGIMSKVIEEEKEMMISCLTKDIKGLKNIVGKMYRYSNNNIRVNYIDSIYENNVVHRGKIIIQGM